MKEPKKSYVLSPAPVDPVPTSAPAVVNSYQKGDKVKTVCKGADVKAEVIAVYKDEVQVRTPDSKLSVYHAVDGTQFLIITKWDHGLTTVSLPEDY